MKRAMTMVLALGFWLGCGSGENQTGSGGTGGAGTGGDTGGSTSDGGGGGTPDACEALGDQLQAALDASLVTEGNRNGGTVGAVLTPTCRWVGATGESAAGTPLLPTDLLRVGSVTKTYVAAALLTLAEEDALGLDNTLDTYVQGVPNGDVITVRELLNHTAGVYNYTNDAAFMNQAMANPTTPVAPQTMVDIAISQGADFAPGTNWNYSNTGYILLGMILEQVGGAAPAATIRERLLDPQGLDRTFLDGEETLPQALAFGWGPGGADWTNGLHPSVPWTAGSMVAEVGELVDWADALYDGDAISASARAEMLTFVPSGGGTSYGLGVFQGSATPGGSFVGHTGGIPGFLTVMYYFQDSDIAVATIVNSAIGDPFVAHGALTQVALAAP